MAEITPVGIEHADSVMFSGKTAHPGDIYISSPDQINPEIPAAHTGTEILSRSHAVQDFRLSLRLIVPVSPVQADYFPGQLWIQFRMSADDISPEHGRLALFDQEFKQLLDIFHVQNAFSLFFRKRCAPSRSQVKGLVCADIEFIRPEQLHILINHFLNQGNGIPVGHIYRMVMHSVLKTESLFKAARQFTEMLEGPGLQQLIEMAECSDGRHQFHSSLIAVLIQFKHFFRGHGSLVPPQLGEITEQICMLHIELQLVHLIGYPPFSSCFPESEYVLW